MTPEAIKTDLLAKILNLPLQQLQPELVAQARRAAIEDQPALHHHLSPFPEHDRFAYYHSMADVLSFYRSYWQLDFFDLFTELIAVQPTTAHALAMTALELECRGRREEAIMVARRAAELETGLPVIAGLLGELLRKTGRLDEVREHCRLLSAHYPILAEPKFNSTLIACENDEFFGQANDYYALLAMAHRCLRPRTYLEVGVATGKSLALVRAKTTALGVDPENDLADRLLYHSLENLPHLFCLTSDELFAQQIPDRIFVGKQLDMAFLDGLHTFEQTLKDFINVEKLSHPGSVVFIHDCLPVVPVSAERDRQTNFWIGDVWKLIPCLKAARPDLEIITLPVPPSGLAIIRGLDNNSKTLECQFDNLVNQYMGLTLPPDMAQRLELLNVTGTDPVVAISQLPVFAATTEAYMPGIREN